MKKEQRLVVKENVKKEFLHENQFDFELETSKQIKQVSKSMYKKTMGHNIKYVQV